jgi:hypothetical protein
MDMELNFMGVRAVDRHASYRFYSRIVLTMAQRGCTVQKFVEGLGR